MVNLEGFKDLVDAFGGVTLDVRERDPGRAAARVLLPLHRARRPQARRRGDPLVRPRPLRLRRLLADGAAEVRDERDAAAGQPADRLPQLRQRSPRPARRWSRPSIPRSEVDRFLELGSRRRSQKVATLSAGPAAGQHRRPRHRRGPRGGRTCDRPRRGRRPARRRSPGRRSRSGGTTGGSIGTSPRGTPPTSRPTSAPPVDPADP